MEAARHPEQPAACRRAPRSTRPHPPRPSLPPDGACRRPSPPPGESPDVRWFDWPEAIALPNQAWRVCFVPCSRPSDPAAGDGRRCRGVRHVYGRSKAFAIPEVPEPHTEPEIAAWMADVAIPTMDVWVADVGGVVVGQMMSAPGWLHHLYIDPAWMRRGLGDRFMTLLAERQPGRMELWAFQSNHRARRFYERHGFVAVEFTDGAANEESWPDVRYVREL